MPASQNRRCVSQRRFSRIPAANPIPSTFAVQLFFRKNIEKALKVLFVGLFMLYHSYRLKKTLVIRLAPTQAGMKKEALLGIQAF